MAVVIFPRLFSLSFDIRVYTKRRWQNLILAHFCCVLWQDFSVPGFLVGHSNYGIHDSFHVEIKSGMVGYVKRLN